MYFSIQRWIFLQALCPHVRSCCAVKLLMLLWFVAQVFTFDKNLSFQRLEQQGLAAKRNPFGITYMGPLGSEEFGKSGYFPCEIISQRWEKYLPRAIRYYPTNRIFALDRADNINIQYDWKHLRQVDLWGKGPNDMYRFQMCKLPIFLT